MKMLAAQTLVLLGAALPAAAYDDLFGSQYDPLCEACLDNTVAICGGVKDSGFQRCICDNEGLAEFAGCLPICNENDSIYGTTGEALSLGLFKYCVGYFPEKCITAAENLTPEDFEETCGDVDLDKSAEEAEDKKDEAKDEDEESRALHTPGLSVAPWGFLAASMLFGLCFR